MATEFTLTGAPCSADDLPPAYLPRFETIIVYEDRHRVRTSRWSLTGVDTRPGGNLSGGWLWMDVEPDGELLAVRLSKAPDAAVLVASGTVDPDALPGRVDLNAEGGSGLGGQLYIEQFTAAQLQIPVLVSLCVDEHLAEYWADLADLPADLYSAATGMARHCAAATRRTLLLVSQLHQNQLGGHGPHPDRRLAGATRSFPDYRRLAVPEQLTPAAACWALELALGSKHQRAGETMYSQLRDHFARQRREAVAQWQLSFNADPDADHDPDCSDGGRVVRPARL
jgi:hypothetical protein